MQTASVMQVGSKLGPAVLITYTWDPTVGPFQGQTVPNGTSVTRPSDGTQWTVSESYPLPNLFDRIYLVLSLVTPPTTPVQMPAINDSLNIGS